MTIKEQKRTTSDFIKQLTKRSDKIQWSSLSRRTTQRESIYTVSQKASHLYNLLDFTLHCSIASIFGTNVAEKVGNQKVLYFPTSHSQCFCTTRETGNPEIASFHLNAVCFFTKKHETQLKLECGPMPNLMVALPNIGGALCSTPQSLADVLY